MTISQETMRLVGAVDPSAPFAEVKTAVEAVCASMRNRRDSSLATVDYTTCDWALGQSGTVSTFKIMVGNTSSVWSLDVADRLAADLAAAITVARALEVILDGWEYDHDKKTSTKRPQPTQRAAP